MSDAVPTPGEWKAHQAFYRLTVAQRDAAWAEVERLRRTQVVPDGLTAAKLRYVASWLDAYDRMAHHYLQMHEVVLGTPESDLARMRKSTQGKDVQTDLRRWADEMDAAADGS